MKNKLTIKVKYIHNGKIYEVRNIDVMFVQLKKTDGKVPCIQCQYHAATALGGGKCCFAPHLKIEDVELHSVTIDDTNVWIEDNANQS